MAFREVRVFEIREVLRLWLRGEGVRATERLVGVDRKTVGRYLAAAQELGLVCDGGEQQLTDVFMGSVVERSGRTGPMVAGRPGVCWSASTSRSRSGSRPSS